MKWDNSPVYRRRRRAVAALAVLLVLTLWAMVLLVRKAFDDEPPAAEPAQTTAPAPGSAPSGRPSATPTPDPRTETPRTPRTGKAEAVTLAFGGDTNADRSAGRINEVGLGETGKVLARADLAMVNLETVVAADRSGLVAQPKQYAFVTGPQVLDRLKADGVDVVTAANNHSMDFGAKGMERMLQVKATSPVPIVGIGKDAAEAWSPWTTEVKGRKVVVFGATDVLEDHLDWKATETAAGLAKVRDEDGFTRLLDGVRQARQASPDDVVVVYLHSGIEKVRCPTDRQKSTFERLSAAGADLVIGSHAHITQTTGTRGDSAFAYGMGNFVFAAGSPETSATGVLTVTVPGGPGAPTMDWAPARITMGVPMLLSGAERDKALATWKTRGDGCS